MTAANDRDAYLAEQAKRIKVGDRLEFRVIENLPIDDVATAQIANDRWEVVEVIAVLPPAASGTIMLLVKHRDGSIITRSTVQRWRWLAN